MPSVENWVELTHTDNNEVLWIKPDKVDMVKVKKERPEDSKDQDYIVLFQLNGFNGEYAMEESLRKPYKSQEAAREWVRRFLSRNAAFQAAAS